jgi:regulator of protease activity HflC (stomatin/prohibitin superfamily)
MYLQEQRKGEREKSEADGTKQTKTASGVKRIGHIQDEAQITQAHRSIDDARG